MYSWSSKRKLIYIGSIFAVLFLFIFIPYIFHSYKKPTCFDGKKNQGELGIDCGGGCTLRCDLQIIKPKVLWSKSFKIVDGIYSAVALIENPNTNIRTDNIAYVFRLKDRSGVVLSEIKGRTFIPNLRTLAIFESGFRTERESQSADFEFIGEALWEHDETVPADIAIRSKTLSRLNKSPRLDVKVENKSFRNIEKLEIIAIVYNPSKEAIGASRTFINNFERDDVEDIVFTWPLPFKEEPATVEIFTKVVS